MSCPFPSQPILRPATKADIPTLARLACEFRDHNRRSAPSDEEFLASVTRLVQGDDAEFILAEDKGEACGYTLLRWRYSMWATGIDATLEDLFVRECSRKHGLGGRLVEAALDRARIRGAVTIHLDTNERNPASNRIYQALGFSCDSKRWDGRQVFYRKSLAPVETRTP